MSNAMIEKHSGFRVLQAQYTALITEQYVVTDQVISAATTARLEAIDLELFRWEGVHKTRSRRSGGWIPSPHPLGQACPLYLLRARCRSVALGWSVRAESVLRRRCRSSPAKGRSTMC